MKLALFADLHANLPAFEACLAHAHQQGAEQIAILGDLVGYGPHPHEVVERCRELQDEGAIVLRGNHDTPPERPVATGSTWGDLTSAWTHSRLDEAQRTWLAHLPLTSQFGPAFLVHATAHQPESWHYVYEEPIAFRSLDAATSAHPDVRYVLGGHVHEQMLYYRGAGNQLMRFKPRRPGVAIPVSAHRTWLVVVGSVGQPRDGDPRANYTLLDLAAGQLVFHRVPYDVQAVCAAIRTEGLPQVLATRLENGR